MNSTYILFILLISLKSHQLILGQRPFVLPLCPPGYKLLNGLCSYEPSSRNQHSILKNTVYCPNGFNVASNGYCQPISSTDSTTATESPFNLAISTHTHDQLNRCPHNSMFINNKCHKIICNLGEYYEGRCLQAACPPGLVWYNKRCQDPAYIITIIEIDNVLVNTLKDYPFSVIQENATNTISFHTTAAPEHDGLTTNLSINNTTTRSTIQQKFDDKNNTSIDCCIVITPRICKEYDTRWVCFNRRHSLCDNRICKKSIMYLRAPEIHYKQPILIMPPNPIWNYSNIETNVTSSGNQILDCSGCAKQDASKCSSYCYRYICPDNICGYIDLKEYCNYYSGQFGCVEQDGCVWNWC